MYEDLVLEAHAWLRSNTSAELRFDEHMRPLRYVITPDGRIVAPVMVAMVTSVDTVLFVSECVDGAMEIQTTLEPFEDVGESGAHADRWRIYHGEPEDVRWAFLEVDAIRFRGAIIDGFAMLKANPIAADEPAICREWNENVEGIRCLSRVYANAELEDPRLVGVDGLGAHVRGRFGVVRIPFGEPVEDGAAARRTLDRLLLAATEQSA